MSAEFTLVVLLKEEELFGVCIRIMKVYILAIKGAPQFEQDTFQGEKLDLLRVLEVLKRKWLWVLLAVAVAVASAGLVSFLTPPMYETTVQLLIDEPSSLSSSMFFMPTDQSDRLENRIQIIHSPLVLDRAVTLLTNAGYPEAGFDIDKRLTTRIVPRTDVIEIDVKASSAVFAMQGANAVAKAYQFFSEEGAKEQALRIQSFLVAQVEQARETVERAEMAVRDYQQSIGVIFLTSEEAKLNQFIINLELQKMTTEISLQEHSLRLNYIEERLAQARVDLPYQKSLATELVITELQQRLAMLEATRVEYLSRGLEGSPEIRAVENHITNMEVQIQAYLRQLTAQGTDTRNPLSTYGELINEQILLSAGIMGYQDRLNHIDETIGIYQQELWLLSEKAFEYAQLERDVSISNKAYAMLSDELVRSRISVEREVGDVHIIRWAVLPESPYKPRIPLNLAIALILGLFVGTGSVFVGEYLDNTIKERSQLEQLGLPLLGIIPKVKKNKQDTGTTLLLEHSDATDPLAIAYIRVESNLRLASYEKKPQVILATSAVPSEGKSTTILNFAYILAHSGQKVLLLDADLRKPVVHKALHQLRKPGLSEVVAGQIDVQDAICPITIKDVSFDVITAGSRPPSIVNLLRSQEFKELLATLRQQYDWILIDLPPIQAGSEALEVSAVADGVLLVVAAGKTPAQLVQEAKYQLDQIDASILGVVLNLYDAAKYGRYGYNDIDYREDPDEE